MRFDVQILVGGFDANPSARLFTVSPPGVDGHYDYIGFWSIGSGAEAAINNLLLREYKAFQPLEDSIYQVAESKFVAEMLQGVGTKTAIAILRSDESVATLTRNKPDRIRQKWESEGRPRMPEKLDETILPLLHFIRIPMPIPRLEGEEGVPYIPPLHR